MPSESRSAAPRPPGGDAPPNPGGLELVPLGESHAEHAAWEDHDLAAMIEGTYGERVEPEALVGEDRARWAALLGDAWVSSPRGSVPTDLTRFWLQAEGRRLGTIALSDPHGRGTLHVSGLYLRAAERGRGLAGAALELAQRAAERQGRRGITLDAAWTWGRPLALYLRLGFRVYHWKRDIRLLRERDQPAPTFAVQGDVATYTVDQTLRQTATSQALPLANEVSEVGDDDEGRRVLLRAVRHGARLGWEQLGGERAGATVASGDPSTAATFALHLALAGFPLVRSRAEWDAHPSGDIGGPELLARRILWWEALARRDGHQVVPGPVPGLTYRSYPDFLDPPELAALRRRVRALLGPRVIATDVPVEEGVLGDLVREGPEAPLRLLTFVGQRAVHVFDLPSDIGEAVVAHGPGWHAQVCRRNPDGSWTIQGVEGAAALADAVGLPGRGEELGAGLDLDPV